MEVRSWFFSVLPCISPVKTAEVGGNCAIQFISAFWQVFEYSPLNCFYVSDLTTQYTALNEISVSVFIGKICHHPCLQEKELSWLLLLVNQLTKCWHDLAQQKNQGQWEVRLMPHLISLVKTCFKLWERKEGLLPFMWKTWKFWLENEMVHTIPFETFQKL